MIQTQCSALQSYFSSSQVLCFHERLQPPWSELAHIQSCACSVSLSLCSTSLFTSALIILQSPKLSSLFCSPYICVNPFHTNIHIHIHIYIPVLPVTLPAELPDPCHQSSFLSTAFTLASSPYSPFHGSWTSCILLFAVVCVLCEWWETERERSVTWSLHILSALTLLRSPWKDVNGRQVNTPGTPRRHVHADIHANTPPLHSQACSNASLKAPGVKGQASLVSLLQGCEVLTVAHYGDKLRPLVWCISRCHRWMFQNTQRII